MNRLKLKVPMEILKPYIQGLVYEYFSHHGGINVNIEIVNNYVNSTLDIVYQYLNGKDVLDARASDYQCTVAMRAYQDFKDCQNFVKVNNL